MVCAWPGSTPCPEVSTESRVPFGFGSGTTVHCCVGVQADLCYNCYIDRAVMMSLLESY